LNANRAPQLKRSVGHLLVTTQQIRAITWLTLLGAVLLSVALPLLVVFSDVGPDFIVGVFAPGVLLISPVHNVIPALIVTVVVDAIVYCTVAYAILRLVLRLCRLNNIREFGGDAQQIVGRERRERVSHHDWSGDA
jgi:hypothetical protein